MFIASLICLILGIALLALAVYFFFALDVREALAFIRNKRTGRSTASSSSRQRRRPNLKSSGKVSDNAKRKSKKLGGTTKIADDEDAKKSKKGKKGSDSDTYVLDEEDSEGATSVLSEDSENPTGLLGEDSENPTGLLEEDSETPTGLLEEDSETPTGLLAEDSENPTGLLAEESEEPTGVLDENKVITKKKDIKKKTSKAKTVDSDFKFEVVKEVVVVHTNESIE